jgi:hypothetical protein
VRTLRENHRKHILSISTIALTFIACATSVAAQQVTDPTRGEFTPSPDHSTVVSGTPVVSSYQLEFYLQGAATPLQTTSIGKPNPDPDGLIRVNLTAAFAGWPMPATLYEAAVVAIGPGGIGRSARSNPFVFSAPCTAAVAPLSQSMTAAGGSGTANVTTSGGCAWTAASNASWITVTSGGGTGNGTVNYTVAANTSTASRTGTLSVAGSTITVTQGGITCTYAINPTSQSVVAAGGSQSATVTAQSGCAWTASESSSLVSITSGANGSGNGTVSYSVSANTSTSPRSATLTIAGNTLNVNQSAGTPCTYTVTPSSQNLPSNASSNNTETVTAPTGCTWTASDNASWLTITSGSSGSGNGTTVFSVTGNTALNPRTATLTVAGQPMSVTQAGACRYAINPTSQSIAGGGGSGNASVMTTTGCNWTATSNVSWITITSGSSGTGSGTVAYAVAASASSSTRTGTLTIAGQTLTITQAAAGPAVPGNLRILP